MRIQSNKAWVGTGLDKVAMSCVMRDLDVGFRMHVLVRMLWRSGGVQVECKGRASGLFGFLDGGLEELGGGRKESVSSVEREGRMLEERGEGVGSFGRCFKTVQEILG